MQLLVLLFVGVAILLRFLGREDLRLRNAAFYVLCAAVLLIVLFSSGMVPDSVSRGAEWCDTCP